MSSPKPITTKKSASKAKAPNPQLTTSTSTYSRTFEISESDLVAFTNTTAKPKRRTYEFPTPITTAITTNPEKQTSELPTSHTTTTTQPQKGMSKASSSIDPSTEHITQTSMIPKLNFPTRIPKLTSASTNPHGESSTTKPSKCSTNPAESITFPDDSNDLTTWTSISLSGRSGATLRTICSCSLVDGETCEHAEHKRRYAGIPRVDEPGEKVGGAVKEEDVLEGEGEGKGEEWVLLGRK
jgi:hypothetical protein